MPIGTGSKRSRVSITEFVLKITAMPMTPPAMGFFFVPVYRFKCSRLLPNKLKHHQEIGGKRPVINHGNYASGGMECGLTLAGQQV